MITFFIRLMITLFAIFFAIIFATAFDVSPLGIMCIFICSWLTISSLEHIFAWILTLAIIFGLIYYDVFGLFMLGIVVVAILFDLIYAQAVRTANNNSAILYGTSFLLSVIIVNILEVVIQRHLFFTPQMFAINVIVSLASFFFFRYIVSRAERFISLYAHGADMRCHT